MLTATLVFMSLSIVVTVFICTTLVRNSNASVQYAEKRLKTFLLTTNEPSMDDRYAAEILLEYKPESATLHTYATRTGMDITPPQLNYFIA